MGLQLVIDIGLFLIYCAGVTLLIAWAFKFWMLYINNEWLSKKVKWDIIEIKLPREINKSPEASEIFMKSVIEGGGLGSWLKENWEGRMPATTSLEIASLEGVIHFYIRVEKRYRPRTEAAIYSQYPDVEINVVDDYMNQIPYDFSHNAKNDAAFWGTQWVLAKKGKSQEVNKNKTGEIVDLEYSGDMYPLKTYKDWGLDKDPKEMHKHDPLTYVLEQMATIGKGEYMCHQIIVRDASKWGEIYSIKRGKSTESGKTLSTLTDLEIQKYKSKLSVNKETKEVETKSIPVVEREEDARRNLELIQRKKNKQQAICLMRTIYVAENRSNLGTRIPIVMGLTRPFNEDGFNTLRPDFIVDPFDFPWQNTLKRLVPWRRERLYYGYVGRDGMFSLSNGMSQSTSESFDVHLFNLSSHTRGIISDIWNVILHPFAPTVEMSGFTLNVEELATLYHFPGEVAATPTLPRIDSVKSSSPSDLPI